LIGVPPFGSACGSFGVRHCSAAAPGLPITFSDEFRDGPDGWGGRMRIVPVEVRARGWGTAARKPLHTSVPKREATPEQDRGLGWPQPGQPRNPVRFGGPKAAREKEVLSQQNVR